jgi:aryl carrier-like protein
LDEITAKVRGLVSSVLGGSDVTLEEPLLAAGLDSIGAVELRNGLQVGCKGIREGKVAGVSGGWAR